VTNIKQKRYATYWLRTQDAADVCTFEAKGYDILQLLMTIVFMMDLIINFNVAIYCEEEEHEKDDLSEWIVKRSEIARVYLFGRLRPGNFVHVMSDLISDRPANVFPAGLFWFDLLAAIPFDWILGIAMGCDASDPSTLKTIRWLRLLRLLRLVRI
jgi:hypothetical protein